MSKTEEDEEEVKRMLSEMMIIMLGIGKSLRVEEVYKNYDDEKVIILLFGVFYFLYLTYTNKLLPNGCLQVVQAVFCFFCIHEM